MSSLPEPAYKLRIGEFYRALPKGASGGPLIIVQLLETEVGGPLWTIVFDIDSKDVWRCPRDKLFPLEGEERKQAIHDKMVRQMTRREQLVASRGSRRS